MASSTLQDIRNKVRRITRSPSINQISNADLDQYINTFIENDIPTTMKLFSLRTILTFYTQPGQDVYETITDPFLINDPLFNFRNRYTAIHEPVYIAGVPAFYTQNRDIFYGNWPQTNSVQQTGLLGNGTAGPFVGFLPPSQNFTPNTGGTVPHILKGSVIFSCLNNAGTSMILKDIPVNNVIGNLKDPNDGLVRGTINYVTGAFNIGTLPNPGFINPTAISTPGGLQNPLWAEYIPYAPGLPTSMLFYDNKMTLRPVPDKSYIIQVEANIRPTELLNSADVPQITQWFQWIAYGAAKKIYEDRMDYNSINMMMPSLKEQEQLVLSTSMEVYTNQRTITPYSNNGGIFPTGWNNNAGWPF